MRVSIDGLQRRSISGVMPAQPASAALPRQVLLVAPAEKRVAIDGLVRRVAQATMPAPLPSAPEAVALPRQAGPISFGASWYTPAAITTATIGIAALGISTGASHLPTFNLSALLPHAEVSSSAATPLVKPTANLAATTAAAQAMQNAVNQQAAEAGVPTGIMTVDLKTGAVASSNANAIFTSASLYKLFVAEAIYRGIDAQTIRYSDTVGNTGFNVAECLNAMITVSSNPCGEALASMVGWDEQNTYLHAAGFNHTLLRRDDSEQTSARDVALLLQKLYNGTLVSPASSSAFINLLKNQQINDRLPVGLPGGVSMAHKTGDLDGFVHDAGIVYEPSGNYIVVAMTGPWNAPAQARSWFANLSSSLNSSLATARASKPVH